MALPRYYLQASKYQNLVTARASEDGFSRGRGRNFFYTARLAGSAGLWPWTDVFMSNNRDSLLIATLTGGLVGVGHGINGASKANIMRAIRPDGALIKPDAPLLLTGVTGFLRAHALCCNLRGRPRGPLDDIFVILGKGGGKGD